MRVLIAPDCFTGTLTATRAAEAIADGWRQHAPGDELTLSPLSDGGPGFVEVLHRALGGEIAPVQVEDPIGRTVPAAMLLVDRSGERTAYLESAQACGLHLLADTERDPSRTSTYGVGQLLQAALAKGVRRIVIGLGGSATNDGGTGMLAALGVGDRCVLGAGGGSLMGMNDHALQGLPRARERLKGIDLTLATDVDVPLLGFHGASASFGPHKGATAQMTQDLEAALGRLTEVVMRALPAATDLLTGSPRRLDRQPGAGAAGGLGYGLMLLGGRVDSGVDTVLSAVGFDALLAATDLVVTGEGTFDWQSLRGKVVAGVARAALGHAVPTIVVAGQATVGRREAMDLGISATYAVASSSARVPAALADPAGTLQALARRIAITWSPRNGASPRNAWSPRDAPGA